MKAKISLLVCGFILGAVCVCNAQNISTTRTWTAPQYGIGGWYKLIYSPDSLQLVNNPDQCDSVLNMPAPALPGISQSKSFSVPANIVLFYRIKTCVYIDGVLCSGWSNIVREIKPAVPALIMDLR
jgi:hypothetical protein